MKIKTLWATRKSWEGPPELLIAQDEAGMDDNFEWFAERQAIELKAMGDDLGEHRVIMLEVDGSAIERAFTAPTVPGTVQGTTS
ncbi:hypothetical protein [Leucobacter sp. cx-169]|uniref:hypothetical protein n=1 Tax=Leucobacter sp. cx-169 TaxID=2770549 RepID=UPI00165E2246|nr:hypothetical protein [Leucobacter sp. cx-169]MBC9927237.1 hypothetical protein [Leucobacter sp. cx-169]